MVAAFPRHMGHCDPLLLSIHARMYLLQNISCPHGSHAESASRSKHNYAALLTIACILLCKKQPCATQHALRR